MPNHCGFDHCTKFAQSNCNGLCLEHYYGWQIAAGSVWTCVCGQVVANGRPYKPTTKCSRCDGKRPEPEQQQQQRDDEEPEYQGSDDDSRSSRDTAGGGGLELDDADAVTEEDKDVNGDDDLDSDDDDIVQQERMPRNRLKIGVPLVVAISLLLMATVSIRHSQDIVIRMPKATPSPVLQIRPTTKKYLKRVDGEEESTCRGIVWQNSTSIPIAKCSSNGPVESVLSPSINSSFHRISPLMTQEKFTHGKDVCVEGDETMSSNSTFLFDGLTAFSDLTINAEYCSEGMRTHHCVWPSNLLIKRSKLYIFGGAANAEEARIEEERLEQGLVRPESISCTSVTGGNNDDQVYELDADSDEVEDWRGHQRSMQHGVYLDLRLVAIFIFAIVMVIVIILFCSLRRVAVAEAARCAAEAARRRAEAARVEAEVQRAVLEDTRIEVEKMLAAHVAKEAARANALKARHADIFGDSDSEGDDPIEPLAPFKWLQSECTNCGRGVGSELL